MMTEQEIISVIKASMNGEQIQIKLNEDNVFDNWSDISAPSWDFSRYSYRVKPKPRVRPYTYEELKEAVRKHGLVIEKVNSDSDSPCCLVILGFDKFHVSFKLGHNLGIDLYGLAEDYLWLDDGSPCGIVEDEKVQV